MARTLDLHIELDTDDLEAAYLAAQDITEMIGGLASVEYVKVLSGVADEA